MALTIINLVTDFSNYDDTNADIIMVREAERTSGNHFIWSSSSAIENLGTTYYGLTGLWQMMYEGPLNVKWFGAKSGGLDATSEIQDAIDFAAEIEGAVYLPNGTFALYDSIVIKNGVRAFYGPGKLFFNGSSYSGQGVIDVEGSFFTQPAVVNCRISIAEINANDIARFCIFFGGANHDNVVHNITLIGLKESDGIDPDFGTAAIQLHHGCYNNTIAENRIYLPEANTAHSTAGINIVGHSNSPDGYYFENSGVPAEPDIATSDNFVVNNFIYRGTHGIQLIGAVRNLISGNNCAHQSARSIIACQSCFNNIIEYNACSFFKSSGIHLCFNSHNNIISNNFIYSHVMVVSDNESSGEGGIQAYVGCSGNTIENNKVDCNSNYGIYVAITASANIISNNEVYNFVRAGIAIESDWILNIPPFPANFKFFRPNSLAPTIKYDSHDYTNSQWPFTGSNKNIITKNIIGDGYSNDAAAIYLSSLIGLNYNESFSVYETIITDNIVATSLIDYHCYILEEDETSVSDVMMNNNNFKTSDPDKFYFTKARGHFLQLENNSVINHGIITITGATPDVSIGKIFMCGNPGSGIVDLTNFTGGKAGQEIIVRLDVFTRIIHNSSLIRLKGGVNASGNADNFITLIFLSGLWFELNRNF